MEPISTLGLGSLRVATHGSPVRVQAGDLACDSTSGVMVVVRTAAEVVIDVLSGSVELTDSTAGTRLRAAAPTKLRWVRGIPLAALEHTAPTEPGPRRSRYAPGWSSTQLRSQGVTARAWTERSPRGRWWSGASPPGVGGGGPRHPGLLD